MPGWCSSAQGVSVTLGLVLVLLLEFSLGVPATM
nr:MAG TPA: hypothetical protein [Caudoviricetes sp.]